MTSLNHCAVPLKLTVVRHLDDIGEPKRMAGHFAEMLETPFLYRSGSYRLRTIIRLMTESFVGALEDRKTFTPFRLNARDSCV